MFLLSLAVFEPVSKKRLLSLVAPFATLMSKHQPHSTQHGLRGLTSLSQQFQSTPIHLLKHLKVANGVNTHIPNALDPQLYPQQLQATLRV